MSTRATLEALIDELLDEQVTFDEALEEFKKLYIRKALARAGDKEGIASMAAKLKMSRQKLDHILRKHQAAAQTEERGKARRHFGVWDSGDERSADNDRIDRDLASEYETLPLTPK